MTRPDALTAADVAAFVRRLAEGGDGSLVTFSLAARLTRHHMDKHPPLRVEDVRAQDGDAGALPPGVEPLGHDALARRLGCSPRTARRRIERAAAAQHRPEVLRVVKLPVPIGSGAMRPALHVLWPVAAGAPCAGVSCDTRAPGGAPRDTAARTVDRRTHAATSVAPAPAGGRWCDPTRSDRPRSAYPPHAQ